MRRHQDAFGHALLDYLKRRGRLVEFVEREDGYIDVSGGRNAYLADYESWPPHHKRAMGYVKGRVLDVGCGAGRHSLYLQRKGFDVQAIDVSPLAIRVCKLRGLKRARVMSIDEVTSKLGNFDTVLMLGANFGLFGNFKKARWLLRRLHNATGENARIIAESLDPYSRNEMRKILDGTGWKVSRFLSSKGPTYIAVIQKQAKAVDA